MVTSFQAKVLRSTKPRWISFLIFLHPKQSGSKIFPWACWFYRRFIKHFSKVSKPLCNLLAKDVSFVFDDSCLVAFEKLKQLLISSPIIQPPNWSLPFELICDVSDYAVGAVLRQRVDRIPHVIYYANDIE